MLCSLIEMPLKRECLILPSALFLSLHDNVQRHMAIGTHQHWDRMAFLVEGSCMYMYTYLPVHTCICAPCTWW